MSSNRASFIICYDGEALKYHEMDVRDLGPALMSLGQLFDEANKILNGNEVTIKVHVKAHSEGSFQISFEVVQSIVSKISTFLNSDFIATALILKELILSGRCGLFWFIERLKGKYPNKITDLKNGMFLIEIENEKFEVPLELLKLYRDVSVRTATARVLKPLENEGVDVFIAKDGEMELTRVEKESLSYFTIPEIQDEKVFESEHDAAYSIVSLVFQKDRKWKLSDGNSTISVSIEDEDFLKKVDNNLISFTKGDVLLCHVKAIQYKTNSGLRTEYTVLKVKEHMPIIKQTSLPFKEE
jgi:hypothetical protein